MEKNQQRNVPVFRKVHEKRNKTTGELQSVSAVLLTPWNFANDKTGKVSSGFSMTIKVEKLGFGSKAGSSRSIILDPADLDLRKAIEEAYKEYDKLNR